jgi:hypothetical protein
MFEYGNLKLLKVLIDPITDLLPTNPDSSVAKTAG